MLIYHAGRASPALSRRRLAGLAGLAQPAPHLHPTLTRQGHTRAGTRAHMRARARAFRVLIFLIQAIFNPFSICFKILRFKVFRFEDVRNLIFQDF